MDRIKKLVPDIVAYLKNYYKDSVVEFKDCRVKKKNLVLTFYTHTKHDIGFKVFQHVNKPNLDAEFLGLLAVAKINAFVMTQCNQINHIAITNAKQEISTEIIKRVKEKIPINDFGFFTYGGLQSDININNFLNELDWIVNYASDVAEVNVVCRVWLKEDVAVVANRIISKMTQKIRKQAQYSAIVNSETHNFVMEKWQEYSIKVNTIFYTAPFSKSKSPFNFSGQFLKDRIVAENAFCKIEIQNEKIINFELSKSINDYLCFVNDDLYQKVLSEAKVVLNNFSHPISVNGKGLLSGKHNVIFVTTKPNQSRHTVSIQLPHFSSNDCIPSLKNFFENLEKEIQDEIQREKQIELERIQFCQDSILVKEILRVVRSNTYVTENGVISVLRGTKYASAPSKKSSIYSGQFKFMAEHEISWIIQKMIDKGILKTKSNVNKYRNYYYTLFTYNYHGDMLKTMEVDLDKIQEKLDNDELLNVYECSKYLEISLSKSLSFQDYLTLLKLLNNLEFCSLYLENFVTAFKDAPKEFKQFIKMKYENESNRREKLVYKKILENIKTRLR